MQDSNRLGATSPLQGLARLSRPFFPGLAAALLLAALLSACSTIRFPGVHRLTIQQGNVVGPEMMDRLKPGMTRSQVRFVLGTAVIDDQLEADRWDYIYTIQVGGEDQYRRVLSLYFVEDRLSYFVGDFVPTEEYQAILEDRSEKAETED